MKLLRIEGDTKYAQGDTARKERGRKAQRTSDTSHCYSFGISPLPTPGPKALWKVADVTRQAEEAKQIEKERVQNE